MVRSTKVDDEDLNSPGVYKQLRGRLALVKRRIVGRPSSGVREAWESSDVISDSEVIELLPSIVEGILKEPKVDSNEGELLSIKLVELYKYINKHALDIGWKKWLKGVLFIFKPWKIGKYIDNLPVVGDDVRSEVVTLSSYEEVSEFIKCNKDSLVSCKKSEFNSLRIEFEELVVESCAESPEDWKELLSRVLRIVADRIFTPKRHWDRFMYAVASVFILIIATTLAVSNWGSVIWVGTCAAICSLLLSMLACLQAKYELEFGVCVESVASSSLYQKIGGMTLSGVPMVGLLSGEKLFSVPGWIVAVIFSVWLINALIALSLESLRVYSNIKLNKA